MMRTFGLTWTEAKALQMHEAHAFDEIQKEIEEQQRDAEKMRRNRERLK